MFVEEMNFGEMKTKAGLIIMSDDGKDRGIKHAGAVYMQKVLTTKMIIMLVITCLLNTDVGHVVLSLKIMKATKRRTDGRS